MTRGLLAPGTDPAGSSAMVGTRHRFVSDLPWRSRREDEISVPLALTRRYYALDTPM